MISDTQHVCSSSGPAVIFRTRLQRGSRSLREILPVASGALPGFRALHAVLGVAPETFPGLELAARGLKQVWQVGGKLVQPGVHCHKHLRISHENYYLRGTSPCASDFEALSNGDLAHVLWRLAKLGQAALFEVNPHELTRAAATVLGVAARRHLHLAELSTHLCLGCCDELCRRVAGIAVP